MLKRQELFKDFLKDKKNLKIRDQLIELHYPLVKKIANKFKYFPKSLQRADLYQAGILGLIKALDNYQYLGCDFIVYATPTIKGEITELIRSMQPFSTSREVFRKEKPPNNISFKEENYQPIRINNPTPHQLWLKQTNHEVFLKKLKSTLTDQEFEIIRLSFGIPLGNANEERPIEYSNQEIAEKLNLSSRQVKINKNKALTKLQKIYKKGA